MFIRRLLLPLALLLPLLACNTSGQGIPGWLGAQDAITWYYENNAWERNASCIPPNMLGIIETRIVEDTPERLVLDVRYLWDVEGRQGDLIGVPCYGDSRRTFVLAKTTRGDHYSVVSMTGPQRSG